MTQVPEGCTQGQDKLSQLQAIIDEIEAYDRFTDFLMPRIDEAAVILLSCTAMKEDLGNVITSELS
jgi:hypothetical protein